MHERLASLFDGQGTTDEKLGTARMLSEAATAAGRIHALERQALGIGADGEAQKSDLDTVLKAMEASREIAGPEAKVNEAAQREKAITTVGVLAQPWEKEAELAGEEATDEYDLDVRRLQQKCG